MSVFGTVFGASGGGGVADWTAAEKEQIRFRLQIDGTQTAPAVDAASQLPSVASSLGSTAEDQVNTQVDSAIETYKLHWLFDTVMGDPADNTFAAKLVSPSVVADWSDYDNATESLGGLVANAAVAPDNFDVFDIDPQGRVQAANAPDITLTTVVATAASFTSFTLSAGSTVDDFYNGRTVRLTDAGSPSNIVTGIVSNYVGSTKTVTATIDNAFAIVWILAPGDTVEILGTGTGPGSSDVNVVTIADNAITANSIAASALTNKGDWIRTGTSYTWTNDDSGGVDNVTVT